MNKVLEIGYPMEYEDDEHIIRTGLWLKEYEVELLEEKLKEYNHIKKQKDDVVEYIKESIKHPMYAENIIADSDGGRVENLDKLLRMLGEIE